MEMLTTEAPKRTSKLPTYLKDIVAQHRAKRRKIAAVRALGWNLGTKRERKAP